MERNDDAQRFADWLRDLLTKRGYDLGPRGGGQRRFAEESGVGRATISRILGGHGATDTRVLGQLAAALRVPLGEVLVRAGIATDEELGRIARPESGPRLTPEQAADELGITDEQARRLFVSMVETLQRTPPPATGEDRLAEH